MDIAQQDFCGKTVLEVGIGRGGMTRQLVKWMAGKPGARLIAADLSNAHFGALQREFAGSGVEIAWIQTDACELKDIPDNSIDVLVCNHTLCAVNANEGHASLALHRFWEVMAPGGLLFMDEEFPIDAAGSAREKVWAEKWRILKAATIIAHGCPYTEFEPEVLAGLCRMAGFKDVQWKTDRAVYQGGEVLNFFQHRLSRLLHAFPNKALRSGFVQWSQSLQEKTDRLGGMEIPFYHLSAQKAVA